MSQEEGAVWHNTLPQYYSMEFQLTRTSLKVICTVNLSWVYLPNNVWKEVSEMIHNQPNIIIFPLFSPMGKKSFLLQEIGMNKIKILQRDV